MFRFLVIFWPLLAGNSGQQSAERFQDNPRPMEVCSGLNIRRFWNFTLNQGECVKGIAGTCQPEGKAAELLALDVDDNFEFSRRPSHLQDGGKELSAATISESYNCSVAIHTVDNNGDETQYRLTAWFKVVDTPKTQDGQLEVRQERDAVRNGTSVRQWHVHLTCGHFVDLGHPAVDVEWKTPGGETLSSSYFHKGDFHLLLSNPVKGGNYTCSLPSLSPATGCLPPGSALLDDVTVDVDELAARISIIEARQTQMQDDTKKENQPQHDVIAELTNKTETLRLGLGMEAVNQDDFQQQTILTLVLSRIVTIQSTEKSCLQRFYARNCLTPPYLSAWVEEMKVRQTQAEPATMKESQPKFFGCL
ncbi:uncharacterized protein [Littorina saxatilis]|uniref:uncharacterized protein n=1 Tax=Littorina saxatilis TaxID=31220 RepID=UPI0038B503A7